MVQHSYSPPEIADGWSGQQCQQQLPALPVQPAPPRAPSLSCPGSDTPTAAAAAWPAGPAAHRAAPAGTCLRCGCKQACKTGEVRRGAEPSCRLLRTASVIGTTEGAFPRAGACWQEGRSRGGGGAPAGRAPPGSTKAWRTYVDVRQVGASLCQHPHPSVRHLHGWAGASKAPLYGANARQEGRASRRAAPAGAQQGTAPCARGHRPARPCGLARQGLPASRRHWLPAFLAAEAGAG